MQVFENKKIKVYVVGTYTSYASWLNCVLVKSMEEADLVLFTGGEDVDPALYKQPQGKFTHISRDRDMEEYAEAQQAMKLNKPIWGTCRGIQLGCVLSGGMLVQHMNHPHMHNLTMYDGTTIQTNSLHHQLQHPGALHPSDYFVAAWAESLSNIYLNGNNLPVILPSVTRGAKAYFKEPELVYYRKTNWLGIQGHPEMMNYTCRMNQILRAMVGLQIEGRLDLVLSLSIPTSRYVDAKLEIHEDELQAYEQILNLRKTIEEVVN